MGSRWALRTATMLLAMPMLAQAADYRIETMAEGLDHPWSLAFLPDGRMLVTERAGRLRVIEDGTLRDQPVAGTPETYVASQGGYFDVLPDPNYDSNSTIYLSFAHGTADANATRLIRGRLAGNRLEDVEVLFTAVPTKDTPVHYGGRMTFLADGTLLLGLGDGFDYREAAQKLDSHLGTIVRIERDGSVPSDNPFADDADALPAIYSYGHRNVQGIVVADDGTIWSHEHGPKGGDEVNRIRPGENYGWPVITYGVDYSGAMVTPYTQMQGMVQPVVDWTPSIAPSGLTLYDGDLFPQWRGDLLASTLVEKSVRRVDLEDGEVAGQETLFTELDVRLRDVRTGPDGALYLLTDDSDGKVLRVTPGGSRSAP